MPIGPHCAVADIKSDGTGGTLYVQAQAINGIPGGIQTALSQLPAPYGPKFAGTPAANFRVIWYEGASSFGGGGTFPVLPHEPAALMSQLVGKPVRVQYMRWDEMGWDNFGPAQLNDLRGGIDANGKIVAYDYTVLGQPGTTLDLTRELTGTPYPTPGTFSPNTPNTAPGYDIPNKRLTGKTLPLYNGYFKNGSLRDPQGPQTAFASEQFIDELAYMAGLDPIEFRRRNISDDRRLTAMNAAVTAANWKPRVSNSVKQTGNVVAGRGFAFGRHGSAAYAGGVVEIEVNKKTGVIRATHIYNGVDPGLAVNPALVENQMTGAAIQGLSRALHEEVRFDKRRVLGLDFVSYPILRFKDHPPVTNVVVQRTDKVPLGVGEPATTPIAPAIANAFFDATGVRILEAPMTPARVRAVLKAAGQ